MKLNTDSLVTFLIMWGIPTFMVTRAYLKMSPEDKRSAMSDFKSLHFIFTIGFMVTGAFLTHLGTLLSISVIKVVGVILLISGGIFTVLDMWKTSKMRSMLILVLLSFVIFLNVT